MNHPVPAQQSPGFLIIALSMITCLILLINVSFKIISYHGLVFSVSSLLCPVITGFYLLALRHCHFKEQRHLLNISLMTLYLFCIGVYVLVNLPAAEYMHDNPVYQIVFEDIPKKFFATTIAFALSFYLPHLLFCTQSYSVLNSAKQTVLLALFGGVSFFCMDFFLLFSGPSVHSFRQILIDSSMIAILLLLLIGVGYLSFLLREQHTKYTEPSKVTMPFPLYYYLICFAVTVMLICLACEYRILSFSKGSILTASALFFPITLLISTLVGEFWGYKANLKLALVLIATQIAFDGLLMVLVAMPSPPFFNLNPFYNYIMPRRLPAASLAIMVTFFSNAMLLHYLKESAWAVNRPWRIFIANATANSLLCLVNYALLFGGIYPYEQIMSLVFNVWQYKLCITVVSLPLVLWFCAALEKTPHAMMRVSRAERSLY